MSLLIRLIAPHLTDEPAAIVWFACVHDSGVSTEHITIVHRHIDFG